MSQNKSMKRDELILKKIQTLQEEINQGLKRYGVTQPSDLSRIDSLIRRGLIHLVGDIFERIKELTDSTFNSLALDMSLVRGFRNRLSHNYGSVDNVQAFAFISYCVSKEVKINVKKVSGEVQAANAMAKNCSVLSEEKQKS